MRIDSVEIPQADSLENVVLTTIAVANGARTDLDIISNIPSLNTDRQGRYYRKASEILGFIQNKRNNSTMLPLGLEFVKNPTLTNPILINAVIQLNISQKLIPFLELNGFGVSKDQLINYIESIAPPTIGKTMIERRVSTIVSWLKSLKILTYEDNLFRLNEDFNSIVPVLEIVEDDQPIIPSSGNLTEYEIVEKRIAEAEASGTITFYRDSALMERANLSHKNLVDNVATRIKSVGGIPKRNKFVDLATTIIEADYIFEMKSTTDTNFQSQIRKGVSQLYEYRYLQNKPEAVLVLVIEQPLSKDSKWLQEYLENDRDINLIWDGNGADLFASARTVVTVPFLDLIRT